LKKGFSKLCPVERAGLGKYATGKACLYVKKIEDVDLDLLRKLAARSVEHMAKQSS